MGLILKEENFNGEPDDLVNVIDRLMAQGSGHLVIDIGEDGSFTAETATECCAEPTEQPDDENDNTDEDND